MAGLTEPFEFKKCLRCIPRPGFDTVPFIDALLIGVFVALNTSAFLLTPGTAVQLPVSQSLAPVRSSPSAVLTVGRNDLYFFEGKKLARLTIQEHLSRYVAGLRENSHPVLLLKADASIPSSSLFNLMDIAREAGFLEIHLAAELVQENQPEVPEESSRTQF